MIGKQLAIGAILMLATRCVLAEDNISMDEQFEFVRPFQEAAQNTSCKVEVKAHEEGSIYVRVTIAATLLGPSVRTNRPPGTLKGDWTADFVLTPCYTKQEIQSLRKWGQESVRTSKVELARNAPKHLHIPHLRFGAYGYYVPPNSLVLADPDAQSDLNRFIQRLAEKLDAIDSETPSEQVLRDRLTE